MPSKWPNVTTKGKNEELIIYPHHIVDDGIRLHARVYSLTEDTHRDLVLSRLSTLDSKGFRPKSPIDQVPDLDWEERETITLFPHPEIKDPKGIETSYEMENGELVIHPRRCNADYIRLRIGLKEHNIKHFSEK